MTVMDVSFKVKVFKKYRDLVCALSFCQLNADNEDKTLGNSGATR